MNELLIVLALVPLCLLSFTANEKVARIGLWVSVGIAFFCHGYFLSLHLNEPLIWGPIMAFFVMVAADAIAKKSFPLFSALGAIFVAQALLAKEMSVILVLISLADTFLVIEFFHRAPPEEKNRGIGNIYRAMISLCPAAIGVLLDLPADIFPILICLTVVLRLFSWPLGHWATGSMGRIHQLIISAGSAYALWHVLDLSAHPEWAVIWLLIATVFSIGAGYLEIYLALNLALFSLSPPLGVLATALWPLLVHQGKTSYLVALGVGAIGALIADFSPRVFLENVDFGLSCLCAIVLARLFVAVKTEKRLWYFEALDYFLAFAVAGVFVYMIPLVPPNPGPLAITFAGVFVATYVIGLLLVKRKEKWFQSIKPITLKSEGFLGLARFDERPGKPIHISDTLGRLKIFELIESESHLIWLLGLLGAVILWGRR